MKRVLLSLALFTATLAWGAQKDVKDIPYVKDGDSYRLSRCKLDVRYPEGVTGFPTVVWFHGGGLIAGSKHFLVFNDRNIAQVAVNYRLMSETNSVRGAECITDAAEAVAWALEHIAEYGGDPKKVYVSGASAGGYLTMMVGMDPRWLARFNHNRMELAGLAPVSGQATEHFMVRKLQGDQDPQFLPKINEWAPLNYVGKDFPPIISICGQPPYEWKARAEENQLLIASCKAMGHPWARFVEMPYFDHGRVCSGAAPYIEMFMKGMLP